MIKEEDTISRQAVLDIINANCIYENEYNLTAKHIKDAVESLPPTTPHPKRGYWILTIEDWNKWTCSECGFKERTDIHVTLGYRFCPKCGAKMEIKE